MAVRGAARAPAPHPPPGPPPPPPPPPPPSPILPGAKPTGAVTWVAQTTVPPARWKPSSSATTRRADASSRLARGSSTRSASAPPTSARASVARCISPVLRVSGAARSRAPRPSRASTVPAASRRSATPRPRGTSPRVTFSHSGSRGSIGPPGKAKPRRRRRRDRSPSETEAASVPSTSTAPEEGRSRVPSSDNSVVFPLPLGPVTRRNAPRSTERETSSTARTSPPSPPGNRFETERASRKGVTASTPWAPPPPPASWRGSSPRAPAPAPRPRP